MADVIKLGVLLAPELKPYALKSYNGTTIYSFFANEIRFIFEALQISYDVIPVPDGDPGIKKPDGNWSGLRGLVARSEVDIAMYPLDSYTEVPQNVHFSYPYGITDLTFMTNKPEPISKNLALVHPFPYSLWVALVIILIAMPILFYVLMKRKVKYQAILLNVFGNLVEQSFNIELVSSSARVLLAGWLLGVMIISYGYKAVLLASLSIPQTTVIRDIAELGRASAQGSVTCFTFSESESSHITESDIESFKDIGACVKRHKDSNNFYNFKSKKVLISSRRGLSFDEKDFYISTDSFHVQLYSFLLSKKFCCTKMFNKLINQLRAVGLDKKFEDGEKFFWNYHTKTFLTDESAPSTPSNKILMSDIFGAFIVLIFGWALSVLALVGEILWKKYISRRKENFSSWLLNLY